METNGPSAIYRYAEGTDKQLINILLKELLLFENE